MIAAEDLPVQVACRVLSVSESGFYEHRDRAPSERAIRHAMLTVLVAGVSLMLLWSCPDDLGPYL